MAVIKLTGFSGERPRIAPRLLPPAAARSAVNARLDNGALTPFRRPAAQTIFTGTPPGTIYRHNGAWLGFAGHVSIARGPVATDRLYYTGDGAPKLRVDANTTYDLAVPRPQTAPNGTASGSGSGDAITRVYVYTFVTALGEESEPSPASNEVVWQAGQTVELTGIENAPATPARGIVKQRFYRSQTGQVGTDLYFIAERDVSDDPFIDTVPVDGFAEPLPSRLWNPPPANLSGLIALPNGMMAGFVGKRLYFCEPYRPHAWPENYVLTVDVPIVALAAAGTTILVLTEGQPYRVIGSAPDAMVMEKVEANLPCINPRGVVDLGNAIAWPSADGLAVARNGGGIGIATANLFAPRDWRRLNPGTMLASQIEGRWIGSYSTVDDRGLPVSGSLIIDLSGESFLIRTDVKGDAWFFDVATGFLYFLDAPTGTVFQFDPPAGDPAAYSWRSKEFVLPRPDTFGAMLIETGALSLQDTEARQAEIDAVIARNALLLANEGGIAGDVAATWLGEIALGGDMLEPIPQGLGSNATINVYADGEIIATVATLDRVARLPAGFTARIWEIDAFADIELIQITMARTVDELKAAAGGP